MKITIFSFLALVVFMTSQAFAAGEFGIEAGIRNQSGSTDVTGWSTQSKMGFQLGGVGAFEISGPLYFRTGLLYTQRPLGVSNGVSDGNIKLNYVDFPLNLMYKFEDYAGVFGGVNLAVNMDNSCDGICSKVNDVKSMIVPIVVGATFKFAPQLGATIYFEAGSGEVAAGLKDYRAVGANLKVTFD